MLSTPEAAAALLQVLAAHQAAEIEDACRACGQRLSKKVSQPSSADTQAYFDPLIGPVTALSSTQQLCRLSAASLLLHFLLQSLVLSGNDSLCIRRGILLSNAVALITHCDQHRMILYPMCAGQQARQAQEGLPGKHWCW